MEPDQWKKDAVARMQRSRTATLRLLEEIPSRVISKPETQGKWSIKDVLTHIIAWEEEACKRLELISKGKANEVYFFDNMEEAHRFNARAVAGLRDKKLPEILKLAAKVRERLISCVINLPPAEIENPAHRYTVGVWLPEFAWAHEKSHRDRIRKWWKQIGKIGNSQPE